VKEHGLAGRVAATFINHSLTLPLTLLLMLAGLAALQLTPREEEPQILVPMVDVELAWPGRAAQEVENRLVLPLEQELLRIPGMDYVYANSGSDGAAVIARFKVGHDEVSALTLTHQAIAESRKHWPEDVPNANTTLRSIDDVPVFSLTLFLRPEAELDALQLGQLAEELALEFRRERDVARVELHGIRKSELLLAWDGAHLASLGLTPTLVAQQIRAHLARFPLAELAQAGGSELRLRLQPNFALEQMATWGLQNNKGDWLHLGDALRIKVQEEPLRSLAFHSDGEVQAAEAVTLAVSKRKGANASQLTAHLLERLEHFRELGLLPPAVGHVVGRDYGLSAKEKSDELILHLLIATFSVAILIALTLGWREAMVVLLAVPVTLAMTLLLSYLLGFTINRVTLFALIFSIGILVDDAIVVVENVHRHSEKEDGRPFLQRILDAVNEVGNPTILATFTVIAAILPMAMVGGLMGPYMLPIPILASLAMLFSLLVAFVVSPWAALRFMSSLRSSGHAVSRLDRLYRRFMETLLSRRSAYWSFWALTLLLFLAALSLLPLQAVQVKMLPFDNKNEIQVLVDLPEGTALEETAKWALQAEQTLLSHKEVRQIQTYVGTAAPITFNGLVRHYPWRSGTHQADLAVGLSDRHQRKIQSHDLAGELRAALAPLTAEGQARITVVEIPPGPPVLSTLVAELYGPDREVLRLLAKGIQEDFRSLPGVVDVDSFETDEHLEWRLLPDPQEARRLQAPMGALVGELSLLAQGKLGEWPAASARGGLPIRLGLPEELRQDWPAISQTPVQGVNGLIALGQLSDRVQEPAEKVLYRKNGSQVVYVVGEVAGAIESPVYALADLQQAIQRRATSMGLPALPVTHTAQPADGEVTSLKWDGEWHITVEVFRDMGMAFAAVVVLIYFLVVGWFRSLTLPLVILSPIPLSLVGILPGHWLFGAFFTATSMIGFIAGAGIIVRNSIILVDFIQQERRAGSSLEQAVVHAGEIRFKPMLLTAAAVLVGASVILFDPIFQGLALSLMMGEVAATLLSRFAVPLLYVGMSRMGFRFPQ
jgi:multidrug efflux pump subunit AcrB